MLKIIFHIPLILFCFSVAGQSNFQIQQDSTLFQYTRERAVVKLKEGSGDAKKKDMEVRQAFNALLKGKHTKTMLTIPYSVIYKVLQVQVLNGDVVVDTLDLDVSLVSFSSAKQTDDFLSVISTDSITPFIGNSTIISKKEVAIKCDDSHILLIGVYNYINSQKPDRKQNINQLFQWIKNNYCCKILKAATISGIVSGSSKLYAAN